MNWSGLMKATIIVLSSLFLFYLSFGYFVAVRLIVTCVNRKAGILSHPLLEFPPDNTTLEIGSPVKYSIFVAQNSWKLVSEYEIHANLSWKVIFVFSTFFVGK